MEDGSFSGRVTFPTTWLLPLLVVLVFIRPAFEPYVAIGRITIDPPDVSAGLAILVAALQMRRSGRRPDRLGGAWLLLGAFLVYMLAECFLPLGANSSYNWKKHLVTWGKFTELALLAPVAAVLLTVPGALRALARTVVALAVVAAAVGLVQFAGVHILRGWGRANREPSFTGVHQLGALGAMALTLAFVAAFRGWLLPRRWIWAGAVAGVLCAVLSAAVSVGIGLAAAAAAAVLIGYRRGWLDARWLAIMLAVLALCEGGILALRAGDISQYTRYIGLAKANHATTADVQSYAQRSLMLYIGYRVWRAHPVIGAGWLAVRDESVYGPQLRAAHREFPDQPAQAFPSPAHPWAVDNAYIQVLAELGIVGAVLLVGFLLLLLGQGVLRSLRGPPERARRALLGTMFVLLAGGIWVGEGLSVSVFADILWLGAGLLAATGIPSPGED